MINDQRVVALKDASMDGGVGGRALVPETNDEGTTLLHSRMKMSVARPGWENPAESDGGVGLSWKIHFPDVLHTVDCLKSMKSNMYSRLQVDHSNISPQPFKTRNPLFQPDLFQCVLDCLDTPELSSHKHRVLSSLARTCRAFSEPSFDRLWYTMYSLKPLIRCYVTVLDENSARVFFVRPRLIQISHSLR